MLCLKLFLEINLLIFVVSDAVSYNYKTLFCISHYGNSLLVNWELYQKYYKIRTMDFIMLIVLIG